MTSSSGARSGRRFVVEADGGSRGNPGPAGYGAVVRDASTNEVLAERAEFLGTATNNFAEYNGLLAGLRAARELDPHAWLDVRLDSRLVVEQMSGRWQVKHPDLRPLVREASSLAASFGAGHVSYTWIPRERNKHADRLANQAMDSGGRSKGADASRGGAGTARRAPASDPLFSVVPEEPASSGIPVGRDVGTAGLRNRISGWMPAHPPTSAVLVRHGATTFTLEKRFSGVGDPPLVEAGRLQAKAAAERLAARGGIDLVVSSPLSRCRETASIIASAVGVPVELDDELREVDFGAWEGLTFATVQERWPRELELWLADTSISPPGGESYESMQHRIRTAQQRLVNRHVGKAVCVVTHSRPIAMLVATMLDSPVSAVYRLHVDNGGVTEIDYYDDGPAVLRLFNDTSHLH